MLRDIIFKGRGYKLIITNHAFLRMSERRVTIDIIEEIIETGQGKQKYLKNKWWVYKKIKERDDNDICLSISIEKPNLIVVTALINWRPE